MTTPESASPTLPPFTRARALISARALRGNLKFLSGKAGVPLLWPMKANAYGHGVEAVAPVAAESEAVWGMAVATPAEALELSSVLHGLNCPKPVVLFGASFPDEWPALVAAGVQLTVSTYAEAAALPSGARAHLKVNTGMNRLGASPAEAVAVGRRLQERGQLAGVFSHFSEAEEADQTLSRQQFRTFQEVARHFPEALHHMGNSSAVLNLGPLPGMDLARPGLSSYGVMPSPGTPELTPAMTLQARITYLHTAAAGERVSYNGLTTLQRDTLIATLPIGYADGYPRRATGQAEVLLAGERRPVLGRVCMDQLMVDATGLDVSTGDWVTLWGQDAGGRELHVSEVAQWSEMAEYEILTRLSVRVERVAVP
ncbi:Alanine racemase [Deinococcus proteolyticus MRP]|uniref:Alanine racemase n=1 Tax=Deinococcus proteolyticus (strain ATCC 35074 / DSM 20540 / JCM 6276 / NBRC 101906 / NCIMB 13154 / VKM Ac-1939 / CCM 2703 / MRP) TaxID=693977 RepID=F0RLQ4_DEIPM|nr:MULTISPECIES: alanine racemase [Deinococcus]ADY25893.1 Alanine racemase [Deinococcus proteolyticus MRP]MCY1702015.1 alanine racemase [Deinococcus sp. SL84]